MQQSQSIVSTQDVLLEYNPKSHYIANFGEVYKDMDMAYLAEQAAAVKNVNLGDEYGGTICPKMPDNFIPLLEAQQRKYLPKGNPLVRLVDSKGLALE